MKTKCPLFDNVVSLSIAVLALGLALPTWADIPAPPVNQSIGMRDVNVGDLQDADCRGCHSSGVENRHHQFYGMLIRANSVVPYPDPDGDGTDDTVYGCDNCHKDGAGPAGGCPGCHSGSSPHHDPAIPSSSDCVSCHGSIVTGSTDGHYIPTYTRSLVTPSARGGDGLPLNSRGKGAGACNYCHDDDGLESPLIRNNAALHHDTGLMDCSQCHLVTLKIVENRIRICEDCHGVASLHNIQVDSPNAGNVGTIRVGGEDAGYGHVGRDGGPGDSDCWGCHGFASGMSAPARIPATMIPTIAGTNFQEADCRGCHVSGVPDRHHLLYGESRPVASLVPYADSDGDGNPDTKYVCLGCHGPSFTVVRDCTVCHDASNPHPDGICGNTSREGPEECDDGNTLDGDCCSTSCTFEAPGTSCADNTYCDGSETCDGAGTCQPGVPVDCSDGISCTNDACDEVNDRCTHQTDNSRCTNDGLFCTGQEICNAVTGCVHTGNPCLPGTTCYEPADLCIPATGQVTICHVPRGNPGKAKTLSVNAGAVADHLAHGDKLGPCPK